MMKTRMLVVCGIGLLVLGIAYFTFPSKDWKPLQTFPASINNDCAPWDGAAFTVTIQYDPTTQIYISIWRAPNIKLPTKIPLRKDSEQDGNAYTLADIGPFVTLNGEVLFQRVEQNIPVEGRFRLASESGGQFEGRFIAAWGNEIAFCG